MADFPSRRNFLDEYGIHLLWNRPRGPWQTVTNAERAQGVVVEGNLLDPNFTQFPQVAFFATFSEMIFFIFSWLWSISTKLGVEPTRQSRHLHIRPTLSTWQLMVFLNRTRRCKTSTTCVHNHLLMSDASIGTSKHRLVTGQLANNGRGGTYLTKINFLKFFRRFLMFIYVSYQDQKLFLDYLKIWVLIRPYYFLDFLLFLA